MGQESQLRRMAGARKTKNSPPIMSQEFIIQNHGDIMSCVVMVLFVGCMFATTASIASVFVAPQHNITVNVTQGTDLIPVTLYTSGLRDMFTVLFYTICCIVAHAVVQEYGLDKLQRKLHLSKTKTSKFTESGQLAVFALYSVAHAGYIINQQHFMTDITRLWVGYPEVHRNMTLNLKAFFLVQLAYWLHQFPEFFFQKSKKDEIRARSFYSVLYIMFILGAYILNFTHVGVCMLAVHYVAELVFHLCRMAHFADKTSITSSGFKLWNLLFVVVRLASVTLSVLTFWYGLRTFEVPNIDIPTRNFNTTFVRLNCLLCVCGLQAWLMWNFITFQLRRMRERSQANRPRQTPRGKGRSNKAARKEESDIRDLPEADQETSRVLRSANKSPIKTE